MTIKLFNTIIHIKKTHIVVVSVFLAMLLALAGYYISKRGDEIIINAGGARFGEGTTEVAEDDTTEMEGIINEEAVEDETESGKEPDKIKVYIVGCVKNPGIFTLEKGQMVYEAIEAAGGATEEADVENINMVYRLEENLMINILPKDKKNLQPKTPDLSEGEGGSESSSDTQSGISIIKGQGPSIVYNDGILDNDTLGKALNNDKKVNINTATSYELETLPGIGKVTADSIINYRQQYGEFDTIEEIMYVSGIKESKFEKIKELIKVK